MPDRDQSRRDFLKKAGTVAWATPMILTMAAPSALAQTSCKPAGLGCGTWSPELSACIPVSGGPGVICCGTCERESPTGAFCVCVGP